MLRLVLLFLGAIALLTTTMIGRVAGFLLPPRNGVPLSSRGVRSVASRSRTRSAVCASSSRSGTSSMVPLSPRLTRRSFGRGQNTAREMSSTMEAAETSATTVAVDDDLLVVRRTAALILSMAVQTTVPEAVRASVGPTWIKDGFYCDFLFKNNEEASDLRERIKAEMDAIIASELPIVTEKVSLEEARKMVDAAELRRLEGKSETDSLVLCRVGNEGWDLCNHDNLLSNTGKLDPGAVVLTSVCDVHGNTDDPIPLQRIAATAFESRSAMVAYKTEAEKALNLVQNFGQLVNWDMGSFDGLECWCCNPDDASQGIGNLELPLGPKRGAQKTRLTEESKGKVETSASDSASQKIGGPFIPAKNPEWIREREQIFDSIRERRDAELASKPTIPIEVTLPDGSVLGAAQNLTSWQSTPLDVARCISDGLANVAMVARVTYTNRVGMDDNDKLAADFMMSYEDSAEDENEAAATEEKAELWDLTRPLEGDCRIEILTFNSDDEDAKTVFWHSSSHVLGQSLEHNYGALLTIGPPVAGGFFYDSYMGNDGGISETQFGEIEEEFRKSVKRKEKFERLVVTKDEALNLFRHSPFKTQLIKAKVPDGTRTTVYRTGDLVDLCMGPHIPHTGKIKAFKLLRCSSTQWLGDANNDQLQRVYGVTFPTKKMLKAHVENLEKAKERDHRRLGTQQKLFVFNKLSPGSAFFLPHGTIIYNALVEFIRKQLRARGYQEVVTPNVYNLKLWEQSGHAQHYYDDMFTFDVEGEEFGMKPMNCPGHCLLFGSTTRSYRELPMRIADFGVLHRNEQSGALTGLTRVRRFQQDDGHIFCSEDQIEQEVVECLEFMKFVYNTFGMTYKLELSTRPEKALGDQALWDRAEAALASAMDDFAGKGNWKENPGDGAFYGPKIDIKVMDAMDRVHQCATIQLDFQLPIRFDLRYRKKGGAQSSSEGDTNKAVNGDASDDDEDEDDYGEKELPPDFERPVMIHRAMLGSVERMFAVLLEHYGGKWPFWLSPRQALVVPVGMDFVPYGKEVRDRLRLAGFHVDIDDSTNTLKKKVREGQLAQYNYILVVGERERDNDSVAVRNRNNEQEGDKKVDDVITEFKQLTESYQ